MAATPFLLQVPSPDSMPYRSLLNGVSAMAISAESVADARAIAKAQLGSDVDVMWTNATATQVAAATNMNGWALRVRVVGTTGVVVVDETVEADGTNLNFVAATGVLTSTQNYANGETVTVGASVYTFKTALTPANGEVLVGASEAASMTNLAHAINGAGGTPNTDYKVAAANASATAVSDGSHAVTITAITAGSAANSVATTETSAHASFGNATLTGGVGATDALSSLALKMVAALNATDLIAGAAWNDSTHTLKVAETTDALGDHRIQVYAIPVGADRDELIGVPGFVGALTQGGSSGAALTAALVADTYVVPKLFSLLGAAV